MKPSYIFLSVTDSVVAFLQEKEINLLRDTHSRNILSSTDGTATVDHVFLGKEGQDFKFSHLANKVI